MRLDLKYKNGDLSNSDDVLIIPVSENFNDHYICSVTSFLYIYDITHQIDYILSLGHQDIPQGSIEAFISDINGSNLYILGKTQLFHGENLHYCDMIRWVYLNEAYDFQFDNVNPITNFHRDHNRINSIIPISSWVGFLRGIRNIIVNDFSEFYLDTINTKAYKFYKRSVDNFSVIERNGIKVDTDSKFTPYDYNGMIYSDFNHYTLTGRPSNTHGGFNLAAMNTTDGTRSCIIPKDDKSVLVEFDYRAFHIRLVAGIIGYSLPEGDVHDYFGHKYFNTDELTQEEYDESKHISFRLLYGNKVDGIDTSEFFGKVYEFRNKLWNKWERDGYINMPLSKRKLTSSNLDDMHENKLFNYFIQCHETEVNSLMLGRLNDYLFNVESDIILYTYDSLLINYKLSDGKNVLRKIREIMETGKFPTSMKYGFNYNELKG